MKCAYCKTEIELSDEAVHHYGKLFHQICAVRNLHDLLLKIEVHAEGIVLLTQGNNTAANTSARRIVKLIYDYKNTEI